MAHLLVWTEIPVSGNLVEPLGFFPAQEVCSSSLCDLILSLNPYLLFSNKLQNTFLFFLLCERSSYPSLHSTSARHHSCRNIPLVKRIHALCRLCTLNSQTHDVYGDPLEPFFLHIFTCGEGRLKSKAEELSVVFNSIQSILRSPLNREGSSWSMISH